MNFFYIIYFFMNTIKSNKLLFFLLNYIIKLKLNSKIDLSEIFI